jgi:hypothetical protein
VRQGAVGVEKLGRRMEKAGHEQGRPCRPAGGAQLAVARNRWAWMTCTVRVLLVNRGGGREADRWAAATVPGGGVADRRDWPISRHGRRGGCGLHGVRVGRGEGGPSPDE